MDKLSLDFQTPDVDTLSTVMILTPPVDFHSPDALEIFEVSDTLRLKTPIHDGAPHGRYIVEDGDKRFLFRFFKGDDINQALADAKANLARTDSEAQQTQRGTDPQPTGQSDVNLVAVPGAAALSTFANTARATVTSALSALTSAGALGGDHTPPPRFGYSRMGQRSSTLREGPSEAPVAQGPQPLPFAPQWPHQAAPGPAGYNPTLGQPQYLQPPYHDLPPYYYPQPQQASMPPPSEQPPPAQAQEPPARAQEPPIQSPNQQRSSRSQQVQQRSSRSQSRQPAAVQTQQRSSRSHSRQHPSRTQQPHTQPQRPLVQQPPVLSQQPQTSVVATVVSQTPRVVPSQAPQAVGPSVQGFVQGRLANSLIPIGSIDQTTDGLFYCVTLTLDRSAHPWNTNDEFIVPIDTGDTAIWLYAKDFLRIEKYGKDPTDWPRSNIDHTKPMVVALTMPDRDGQHTLRPYIMTRNPFVKNNDCKDELEGVEYVDNTAVYTRCFRDLKLTTNFPTWNWMTQTIEHNFTVALPCTLAYAANDSMVQTKYDGNLGLGVPKVSSLFLNSRSSSQRRPFMEWYDAISDRRVHSSREFYLRLISPQVFKECQNAHSFICFSSQFPCNHVPEFTAPLQLSMSQHALTSSISRHWNVSLMGMSLQQYRLDRNGKKKDVGLPIPLTELEKLAHDHELAVQHHEHILRREPQQRRTNLKIRGLIVTLDSASTNSRLPWQVVDELAVKWLQNSPFPSGTSIHTNPYYDQGAENSRDLKRCDIIFTFYDEGTSQEYAFRCPSEPFLSSMWPAYAQPQEGMHSAPFSTQAKSSLLWGVRGRCILGMNFHWAAIVHYVGPKLQNGHHLQPPYVRFAPQRVVKYDQTAGKYTTLTEKDLVLDPRWVHRCST